MDPQAHSISLRSQLRGRTLLRRFVVHSFELGLELSFLLSGVISWTEQLIGNVYRHASSRSIDVML